MSLTRRKQPQSKSEFNNSDWESLKLWSTNDSSSRLNHLIEREALPATVQQREVKSSTKTFCLLGFTLCLILYSLGLITLSTNIHSHTQRPDSKPNKIELELADDFR